MLDSLTTYFSDLKRKVGFGDVKKYRTTDGSIVDATRYSELDEVKFLMNNPDATELTEEELRYNGSIAPMSEDYDLINEVIQEDLENKMKMFKKLKFGTYSHKEGYSIGGKGDKVSRADFQNDEDYSLYQKWNEGARTQEDFYEQTLEDEVNDQIQRHDLDLDPQTSSMYYNRGNMLYKGPQTFFIDEFFKKNDLESIGINIQNFQGFLNKKGITEDFLMDHDKGVYDDDEFFKIDINPDGKSTADLLAIQKQRVLSSMLEQYVADVQEKLNKKRFVQDYRENPEKYKDLNFDDAYKSFITENKEATYYDFDAYNNYYKKNFPLLVAREKEILQNQKKYIEKRQDEDNVDAALNILGNTVVDLGDGLMTGVDEGGNWLDETLPTWLGGNEYRARQNRLIEAETELDESRKNLQYFRIEGKSAELNGKRYLMDKNGNIYDMDLKLNIGNTLSEKEYKKISSFITINGVDDYDYSARGALSQGAVTLGEVGFQIIGTKGIGTARLGASKIYINVANKSRTARNMSKISTRARSATTGRFVSTKGTFGTKLPFDARILDASAFQGVYGNIKGYESTIKAAKNAGLTNQEAEDLATAASREMSLLYALTGPINPRLPMLNKLDDLISKNDVVKTAINEYVKTGSKKTFSNTFSNGIKKFIPNKKTLLTIVDQGFRELVQENIQQAGEMFIVNRNTNDRANMDIVKTDYSKNDFIQTSILSFAVGGLVGGMSVANFRQNPNTRLTNLYQVSRNIKSAKKFLGFAVQKGQITTEQANDIIKQAEAIGKVSGKAPAWMINTPQDFIDYAMKSNEIDQLVKKKQKLDKGLQNEINEEIKIANEQLQEISRKAAAKAIDKETKFIQGVVGKENVKTFETVADLIKAGFSQEMFTDGFLEQDGIIYINKEVAAATQAVSVASHELLHKVLQSEFKSNPEMKRVVDEFKQILKDKGIFNQIEQRMDFYRQQGLDVDGVDADEYFTAFSDAIAKNEIPFSALEESQWMRIGRRLLDLLRTKFGLVDAKFTSGQQVYDFIRDYQASIKQGVLAPSARRKLSQFEKTDRKRSLTPLQEINKLVPNTVQTKEDFQQRDVFNPIYQATQPGGVISNYVNSRATSRAEADKMIDEVIDRLINYDPQAVRRTNSGEPITFGEFIFANTRFSKMVAKKALAQESETRTTSIDDTTKQIADTSTQTQQTVEGKKYIKIKDSGINPRTKEAAKSSVFRIVRTLKSGLTDAKSLNRKVSPIMSELLNEIGNSPLYDAIIKELGTRSDLRTNLLKFKKPILENLTTTWLMRGIPQAIQKQVDGSFTSDWQGKKIDRETVGTDNAGRTSGHDLVRRAPNVNEFVTDEQYLSNFYDAKGKLIRGRKEALAKQMAQEYGLEILIDELQNNKTGDIAVAFDNNQEVKGIINALGQLASIIDQADRGGIKRSITDPAVQQAFEQAVLLGLQGRTSDLENFFDNLPTKYSFLRQTYDEIVANEVEAVTGFIKPLKQYSNQAPSNIKPYIDDFLNMSVDEKKKAIYSFTNDFVSTLPANVFEGEIGESILGLHYRVLNPNSNQGKKIKEKLNKNNKTSTLPFDPSKVRIIQAGSGLIGRITTNILNKDFKTQKEAEQAFDNKYSEEVNDANAHNLLALEYLVEKATDVIIKDPSKIPGYLFWFQSNSNIGKALRGLTTVEEVQIFAENQAPFVSKADVNGVRKGYSNITGVNKAKYENGEIIINQFHPVFKIAQDYMKKKGYELNEKQYQKRLRPKGEHKVPSSNKMNELAVNQLDLVSVILKNNNEKAINSLIVANRALLTDIVSNFSQSIGTEVLSAIQDDVHGITSSLGDLRIFAIPENQIKSFYPTQGNIQAFSRGQRELETYLDKLSLNKLSEIQSKQQAIDNSRKRSYSINPNGISVYDFDDTLAFSDSKIIVTMPNGKVKKITPAQFAAQDETLKAQGATFDFSEFNKVVKGRPGPLAPRLKKAIEKFGNKNIYVLTARPQASAKAIYNFLKGIGLEIPLKNITGLENGTPAAKAAWMVNKVAQGYNDFYFVDDAYKNVAAVQNVLDVFDVKRKIQQAIANRKRSLSLELNEMIARNKGIKTEATFSKVLARKKGAKKGKFKFFLPHSAEDFRGLTSYTLAGKGKQGEADQKFFEDNLVTPYTRGIAAIEHARQALKNDYRVLLKGNPEIKKNLNKRVVGDFTLDQAIRVYLYSQSGFEIPGISKRDKAKLLSVVMVDPNVKKFADTLQLISKKKLWVEPGEHWDIGSILKDLNTMTEKVNRAEYLAEFIENVDQVFSDINLNKLEAIYGSNYVSALKDVIRRMKSGVNRPARAGKIEQAWLNWVNNSVGTIMFFNRRSALLQMISFTNFVNWSDNNPLAAASAFANQPEYWKAWSEIFNSDKLKQRRGGLRSDVQEQEIANQARNSKDKAGAIIAYLLKIGFTPTQIADSMAIATGGATLLINRTKTYQKQGMNYKEARAKAFEDFSKISDETQQSGDPMLISQQQSSHLGRLILAFQNTPMQYTRLMKKAGQDLINGRGSATTNISKIMYYGFIQNLIFTGLQQALFALLPEFDPDDEDDEKYQKLINTKKERIINGMLDTILRGSGLAGAVVSTIKNTINRYYKEEKKGFTADHTYTLLELANVSPPIGSKLRKIYSALQTKKFDKDVIAEMGMDVTIEGQLNISPSYEILGNILSSAFNLPLDRAIVELNAISEALDDRNTAYQRIALMLGWRTWDVNAKNEEQDVIKLVYKELRRIEGIEKSKRTRLENKIKEKEMLQNMTKEERIQYNNEKYRKNSERARKAAETRRRNMSNN